MGRTQGSSQFTRETLAAIPGIREAHIIAGAAVLPVKIRTATTEDLPPVLRSSFDIGGVTGTQTIVVAETFFEPPVSLLDQRTEPDPPG